MKISILSYLSVGIGGMLGASLRYGLGIWFSDNTNIFPWATLTVNLSGAFLLSFLLFLPVTIKKVPPFILTGATTGILGAYTTYSTLTLEIVQLVETHLVISIIYLILSIFGGLFFSFIGYKISQILPAGGKYS